MSKIGNRLGFVTLTLLSIALLVSTVGASYYGDHDRHAYLGATNIDRNLVKPVDVNPLLQINTTGILINYQNPSTLSVWNYLGDLFATAYSPQNEQDYHYDDSQTQRNI